MALGDECGCLDPQTTGTAFDDFRNVGVDLTNGRYGDVRVERCRVCGRLWLHYHVEYEAFSGSGRWYRGIVTSDVAQTVTPERAVEVLEALDFNLYGGSYFGSAGRSKGHVRVDL
jgi:hypothetical protein